MGMPEVQGPTLNVHVWRDSEHPRWLWKVTLVDDELFEKKRGHSFSMHLAKIKAGLAGKAVIREHRWLLSDPNAKVEWTSFVEPSPASMRREIAKAKRSLSQIEKDLK